MDKDGQQKKIATRIIGLDYGMARIGIAMSDETKTIAMSIETMTAERKCEQSAAKLLNVLARHQKEFHYEISEIVIGLPLLLNGKKGLLADEVNHFSEQLKLKTQIPIVQWDERLTSVQADRSMREGLMTRKKRSQKIDAVSAVILLQSYLDSLKRFI